MPSKVRELKRNPGKPDQKFYCDLVSFSGNRVVLSYVSDRDYRMSGRPIPAGSHTLAFYDTNLPYVLWRMTGPAGDLLGHYVHLCDQVSVSTKTVSYRDLLLDIWFDPDGTHRVLDDEELSEAVVRGYLSPEAASLARRNSVDVIDGFSCIQNLLNDPV